MSRRSLTIQRDRFRLKKPFTIARGSIDALDLVSVAIKQDGAIGRGECRPYPRYGETSDSVTDLIEQHRVIIEDGCDIQALNLAMAAGAARNALDCALWDLEAKRTGKPVHELIGLPAPSAAFATYTLGLDSPDAMAAEAAAVNKPILKLKLGDPDRDLERVQAVRAAAPASRLIIDANEGWSRDDLDRLLPGLHQCDVEMIEQPLPAGEDDALEGLASPVTLCADESCHTAGDVERLKRHYGMVNIKIDKTGGITGALALMQAAKAHDLRFMIGCMMASSLSMAPAQLFAVDADYIDLDAPLLLAEDRDHPIRFEGALMHPASPRLWG